MPPTILSLGQCGFDNSRLARFLTDELSAPMDRAHSADEARQLLAQKKYDLLLVNRVFDLDGASGLDFIAQLKKDHDPTPTMLISNYPEAQSQAIAHGALPGFGKNDLANPDLSTRLRTFLATPH